MSPRCVLVGAPGSGKTAVGQALADLLGVAFHDTDHDVEARAGASVADVFLNQGEEHFRTLEAQAVATAMAEHDGVLALGGGAVLDATTRAALVAAAAPVVWLQVGLTQALERVGLARSRPVLAMSPRARLAQLLAERTPLYEEVADLTVSSDEGGPADVAAAVAEGLRSVAR